MMNIQELDLEEMIKLAERATEWKRSEEDKNTGMWLEKFTAEIPYPNSSGKIQVSVEKQGFNDEHKWYIRVEYNGSFISHYSGAEYKKGFFKKRTILEPEAEEIRKIWKKAEEYVMNIERKEWQERVKKNNELKAEGIKLTRQMLRQEQEALRGDGR